VIKMRYLKTISGAAAIAIAAGCSNSAELPSVPKPKSYAAEAISMRPDPAKVSLRKRVGEYYQARVDDRSTSDYMCGPFGLPKSNRPFELHIPQDNHQEASSNIKLIGFELGTINEYERGNTFVGVRVRERFQGEEYSNAETSIWEKRDGEWCLNYFIPQPISCIFIDSDKEKK